METQSRRVILPERWLQEDTTSQKHYCVTNVPLPFGTLVSAQETNIWDTLQKSVNLKGKVFLHETSGFKVAKSVCIQGILISYIHDSALFVQRQHDEYCKTWRKTRDDFFDRRRIADYDPLEAICFADARNLNVTLTAMYYAILTHSSWLTVGYETKGYVANQIQEALNRGD